MADDRHKNEGMEEETPSYVPASPAKRVAAWVGIVYMVIIVLLTAYNLATGHPMNGVAGLLFAPAAGGFAVVNGLRIKGAAGSRKFFHVTLMLVSGALCLFCLYWGVIGVLQELANRFGILWGVTTVITK